MAGITKKQQKILILSGIGVLMFLIFVYFIYLPTRGRMTQLRRHHIAIQAEIAAFKKKWGEDKPLEESILFLRNKLLSFDEKFPKKEEIIFKELAELAENHGVEIVSMNPGQKRVVTELGTLPINIQGHVVEGLNISMNAKASYKRLGDFFMALREEFPIFVRVNHVDMGKAGEKESALLNVNFDVDTYLIVPVTS